MALDGSAHALFYYFDQNKGFEANILRIFLQQINAQIHFLKPAKKN